MLELQNHYTATSSEITDLGYARGWDNTENNPRDKTSKIRAAGNYRTNDPVSSTNERKRDLQINRHIRHFYDHGVWPLHET